jgi:uncharacterized damage-inducible protein DinB
MITFRKISKPKKDEYPSYSQIYMDLVKDDDLILDHLSDNFYKFKKFIYSLPIKMLTYRYAEGKWTIKEILVHLIDTERALTYRALRYARNDSTALHAIGQDSYSTASEANERSLEIIFDEYEAVRRATILLFQNLPDKALVRRGGILDPNGKVIHERTARSLAYHIAGHELHHLKIIKEKYLKKSIEDKII